MKQMVRHEAELGTVKTKRVAGTVLFCFMLFLAPGLAWLFLSMGTEEMRAVAAGVLILAPSLFYTSLLATAATGTARMRWVYRLIGFLMTAVYLFGFSAHVPNQFASVVLTVAGIGYCFLVDVFSPHCTGKTASWRDLWTNKSESENELLSKTGVVPAGLHVELQGDFLWGVPKTGGSFTLQVWDGKARAFRDVTYDVTVRDLDFGHATRATTSTASGLHVKPGNTTGSTSKDALPKSKRSRKRRKNRRS